MTLNWSELRVLICANSETHRNMVLQILRACGIKNVRGSAAVVGKDNLISSQPFDLIIGRLRQNDTTILEVVKWLRTPKATPAPGIPVLVSVTATERAYLSAAIKTGVDMLVAEPLNIDGVKKRIQALIGNPLPRITTESYVGPDRRRTPESQLPYRGAERRKAAR